MAWIWIPHRCSCWSPSLPPGVTASVAVRAIMRGQFSLLENRQLISVIYWISCTEVFLKDVAVNIQHCAVITKEDSEKFNFIVAKCSEGPPYKFVKKDGPAFFSPQNQYATIWSKRFCLYGADAPNDAEKYYVALKFYKPIPHSVNMNFRFVVLEYLVIKNNEYIKQMIKQQWTIDEDDNQQIRFDSGSPPILITLNISKNPPLEVDNWKIVPRSSPLKIYKATVDAYEVENGKFEGVPKTRQAPSCNIQLQWIGPPGLELASLFHDVAILGTTESDCSFTISYYPGQYSTSTTTEQAGNESDHQSITTELAENGSDHQPRRRIIAPTNNHLLSERKIRTLMSELASITEWRILGMHLGVVVSVLNTVESENRGIENQKMDMLSRWIRPNPKAAWEDVISALRRMNENRVADYIEGKYCAGGQDDLHAVTDDGQERTQTREQLPQDVTVRRRNVGGDAREQDASQDTAGKNKTSSNWILLSVSILIVVISVLVWFLFR